MAVTTSNTNKPILPRGADVRPIDSYNRAALYSGKALDFDGVNDNIIVNGIDSVFNYGNAYTMASYFKIVDPGSGVLFGNSTGDYFADLKGLVYKSGANSNFYPDGSSSNFITINTGNTTDFVHIVCVSDGTTASAYLNGQFVGSTSVSSYTNTSSRFSVGSSYSGNFGEHEVAGVKVFNTALTAAQIADLYNNPEKIVPTGVANTALKLWLPMQEGAGTTAYNGSPVGFTEDIVTGFTNGTTYPLDSFVSSGDDITTAIKTSGFGGCVSNGHTYYNGQKVKVKFTYQKNSGDDLRVLFSSFVTGAGTAISNIQNVSASGEFEHTFTMTADGVAYLQLGTGNAGHSINAVITDVYVSPNVSANHGTISGATYVNGVGAPVAQTAVIDWNKGVNETNYSDIQQTAASNSPRNWIEQAGNPWTPSNATGPTGLANSAGTYTRTSSTVEFLYNTQVPITGGETYTVSAWVKLGTASNAVFVVNNSVAWNTVLGANYVATAANGYDEWKMFSITFTAPSNNLMNLHIGQADESNVTAQTIGTFYVYGVAIHKGSTPILVPTNGTAQTSPVLLPAGLTTGRDITGVNLFENVRKQGALNLDGNSWAEVHDNESLDVTPAMSLECWIKCGDELNSDYDHVFVKPTSAAWASPYGTYVLRLNNSSIQWWFDSVSNATSHSVVLTGWNYLSLTKDGTSEILYLNGVQVDTFTGAATISSTAFDLIIGTLTSKGPSESIANQLAQPRIYNRALTASEVLNNYNVTKNLYI